MRPADRPPTSDGGPVAEPTDRPAGTCLAEPTRTDQRAPRLPLPQQTGAFLTPQTCRETLKTSAVIMPCTVVAKLGQIWT